jgi:tetratricopeptide (TPR) repeat protein
MSSLTSPRVIRRFIIVTAVATFVMFTFWAVVKQYVQVPPGDYEVRQGDILLGDKKFDEALERFNAALEKAPDHRGALMGRAIVFLQTSRYAEAEAQFTHLIDNLTATVAPDDSTGIAVLAGAYANRGIMYDRMGQYEKALKDYVQALKTDEGAVEGPGVIDKILYSASPSTVRKRAIYLHQQLALPKEERLLHVPELDAQQRMYKP